MSFSNSPVALQKAFHFDTVIGRLSEGLGPSASRTSFSALDAMLSKQSLFSVQIKYNGLHVSGWIITCSLCDN